MLSKIARSLFLGSVGIVLASPLAAQDNSWRIDPAHSMARLFLESSKSPGTSVNVGVARINGEVDHVRDLPGDAAFDFTIYPADEASAQLSTGNKLLVGTSQEAPGYTVITFKSKQTLPTGGGACRVIGALTMMYIERDALYDPNKGYSGPVFGPAVYHSEQRDAVFEFHQVGKFPLRESKKSTAQLSGSIVIGGKDFPDLLTAVSSTDWPVFVADERCVMPSTVGEDFSGPVCTGKVVEPLPRVDIHCQMSATVGESFSGEVCTGTALKMTPGSTTGNYKGKSPRSSAVPGDLIADQVKIQLDMRLLPAD